MIKYRAMLGRTWQRLGKVLEGAWAHSLAATVVPHPTFANATLAPPPSTSSPKLKVTIPTLRAPLEAVAKCHCDLRSNYVRRDVETLAVIEDSDIPWGEAIHDDGVEDDTSNPALSACLCPEKHTR
jgi:hypothetical protein